MLLVTFAVDRRHGRALQARAEGLPADPGHRAASRAAPSPAPTSASTRMAERQKRVVDVLLADPAIAIGRQHHRHHLRLVQHQPRPAHHRAQAARRARPQQRGGHRPPAPEADGDGGHPDLPLLGAGPARRRPLRRLAVPVRAAGPGPGRTARPGPSSSRTALRGVPGIEDVTSDQDRPGPQANVVIDRDAAAAARRLGQRGRQRAQQRLLAAPSLDHLHAAQPVSRGAGDAAGPAARPGAARPALGAGHRRRAQSRSPAWSSWSAAPRRSPCATRASSPPPRSASTCKPGTQPGRRDRPGDARPRSTCACRRACAPSSPATRSSCRNRCPPQPLLIGAAFISIYIVLGVLYESLLHPLTIISTLPSAGLGRAAGGAGRPGTELGVLAIIGIVLLMGIVKKNAHHAGGFRARGGARARAAGRSRRSWKPASSGSGRSS